ncbi:type II toxin-antitoxin system RelE/ParE family toxin [Paraburkholderia humisilvae]
MDDAVEDICTDPNIGEQKVGDLAGSTGSPRVRDGTEG